MIAGISARFSNFPFVLFCYITNHLIVGPLGTVNFVSIFLFLGKQNSLFPSGPVIKCLLCNTKSCQTTPMDSVGVGTRDILSLHLREIQSASYKKSEELRCEIWRGGGGGGKGSRSEKPVTFTGL